MDDSVFDALADEHRRRLLVALDEDGPRRFGDPESLDEWLIGEMDAERARAMQYHVHLPKLADEGFVTWDRETGEVAKGPAFERLEPLLGVLRERAGEVPASDD